jgi:hypothetical protein
LLRSAIPRILLAAGVTAAAVLLPVTSASAADPPVAIAISGSCALGSGTEKVTYTVTTAQVSPVTVQVIEVAPATASIDRTAALVQAGAPATFVETIPPGDRTARVKLRVDTGAAVTEVSSEILTFACGEAFFTKITGAVQCDPATGISTVTYTVTPRPGSRLVADVITVVPPAPTSTVTPTQIRNLEPSGQFVQTISALGPDLPHLVLKLTVKTAVIIGQKAGPNHAVNVNTPFMVYFCP